jgi:hypothetical protein
MDFVEWMKSLKLSEKSANSYSGAIKGRLTNWALAHGLTTKQIAAIFDPTEFAALAVQIKQTPEFKSGMGPATACTPLRTTTTKNIYSPWALTLILGQANARARVLREVIQRRGQQKFRKALIAAYSGRCAISGCPVAPLLEAAHITSYLGPDTNSITNGLLLRADLHTLWIWVCSR